MGHRNFTEYARTEEEKVEKEKHNRGIPGYSEVYHRFTCEVKFTDGTEGWELHFEEYYG